VTVPNRLNMKLQIAKLIHLNIKHKFVKIIQNWGFVVMEKNVHLHMGGIS
jgi:hypothetical protein